MIDCNGCGETVDEGAIISDNECTECYDPTPIYLWGNEKPDWLKPSGTPVEDGSTLEERYQAYLQHCKEVNHPAFAGQTCNLCGGKVFEVLTLEQSKRTLTGCTRCSASFCD